MRYGAAAATSIDLYVSEMAAHSQFRVEVIAECGDPPLPAAAVHALPRFAFAETQRRSRQIAALARRFARRRWWCSSICRRRRRCGRASARRSSCRSTISCASRAAPAGCATPRIGGAARQLNALAGLTFVSRAVLAEFERDWPEVTIPRRVVANGFDAAAWRPQADARTDGARGRARHAGERDCWRRRARWPRSCRATPIGRRPSSSPSRSAFPTISRRLARRWRRSDRRRDCWSAGRSRRSRRSTNGRRSRSRRRSGANRSAAPASRRTPAAPRSSPRAAAACARSAARRRSISPAVEPARIAEAVETLIVDEPLRERLAAEGRARVERLFDVRRVAADARRLLRRSDREGEPSPGGRRSARRLARRQPAAAATCAASRANCV